MSPFWLATSSTSSFGAGIELITVDAVVLGEDGEAVRGLGAGDFVVLDDGEAQTITRFEAFSSRPAPDADPAALRAYAETQGADLESWSFLTGERDAVADVIDRYHVGVVPGENQELLHMPITYLIDAEGGIVKRYVGTTHTAEEIGRDLVRQAS